MRCDVNNINDLIIACEKKLHVYEEKAPVGNRPHYPVYITFNESFTEEGISHIYSRIRRFWPSAVGHELFYRYKQKEGITLERYIADNESLKPIETENVGISARETSMQRDVHADLSRWRFVNVIDTKGMESSDEFAKTFYAGTDLKKLLGNQTRSTLIVILRDEKSDGEDTATDIREFLCKNYKNDESMFYDSVVLVSDLKRDNSRLYEEELLSIAADLVVIADNDAVTQLDDDDYTKRSGMFFGGKIYSVSYRHLERPNEKIAKQICDLLITAALEDAHKPFSKEDLGHVLDLDNGKFILVENILNNFFEPITADFTEALPVNKFAVDEEINISEIPFNRANPYFADSSIMDILAEKEINNQAIQNIVGTIEKRIKERFKMIPLFFWDNDDTQGEAGLEISGMLDSKSANDSLDCKEYYCEKLKEKLRVLIKERIPSIYDEFKENALTTKDSLLSIYEKYEEVRPVNGYKELGTQYKLITENFIRSHKDEQDSIIHSISIPGNGIEQILSHIKECFDYIVDKNENGIFTKSFNKEYEMRLEESADLIYRRIQDELNADVEDRICLFGSYTRNKVLDVYMLHTFDETGNNETELYGYLKNAFENSTNIQYLNTGFDDELDAVSFFEIRPDDLIRGCR